MADPAQVLLARAERYQHAFAERVRDFPLPAAEALAKGQDVLRATFDAMVGADLRLAFAEFAIEAAETDGLPVVDVSAAADQAAMRLVEQMVTDALPVLARIGRGRPALIREQIGLTEAQNGWVAALEKRLRHKAKAASRNDLYGMEDPQMAQARIRMAVKAYRDGWRHRRAVRLAQHHLLHAVNATYWAAWSSADDHSETFAAHRKFWWDRDDHRVREGHAELKTKYADGIPVRDTFVTRHGNLRYPLDPLGHGDDVNGCRCINIIIPQGAV